MNLFMKPGRLARVSVLASIFVGLSASAQTLANNPGSASAPTFSSASGEESNPVLDEPHTSVAPEVLAQLPERLDCGSVHLVLHKPLGGSLGIAVAGTLASLEAASGPDAMTTSEPAASAGERMAQVFSDSKTKMRVLADVSNGSQVDAFWFSRSDLLDLTHGELKKVDATETSGVWSAEGGHLTTTDVVCKPTIR